MPITYNPTEPAISVVGDYSSYDNIFYLIYQEAVNNNWLYDSTPIAVLNQYGIEFRVKIYIGDGSTSTLAKSLNEVVRFYNIGGNPYSYLHIRNKARLILGELIDERGVNGSILRWDNGFNWPTAPMTTQWDNDCDIEIYGSILISQKILWSCCLHSDTQPRIKVIDSLLKRAFFGQNIVSPNGELKRVVIKNCNYGVTSVGVMDDVVVLSDNAPLKVAWGASGIFKDVKIEGSPNYFISCWSFEGQVDIIDVESHTFDREWTDLADHNTGTIYLKYTFNRQILDKDGNPLSGRTVKLIDRFGTIYEMQTGTDGRPINPKELLVKKWVGTQQNGVNVDVETDYNPFTIQVWYGAEKEYEAKINVNKLQNDILVVNASYKNLGDVYERIGYGILNRETMHKSGSTIKMRFKSKSSDKVKIYVYKPDGAEVVNTEMAEVGNTGIYYYDLTFYKSWGVGDFLVKCVDITNNIEDAMTITILSEDDWFATHSDIENMKIPKVIEL